MIKEGFSLFFRGGLLTNQREEEYDRALNDLQAPLRGSAGQSSGTYVLVPAAGVPERVLSGPPDASYEEEAPGERMALEAPHGSQHLNRGRTQIYQNVVMDNLLVRYTKMEIDFYPGQSQGLFPILPLYNMSKIKVFQNKQDRLNPMYSTVGHISYTSVLPSARGVLVWLTQVRE